MEVAYDAKELLKKVQAKAAEQGLTMAEESLEVLIKAVWAGVKEWGNESAVISANPVDNFVMPALNFLDGYILPQIDKIDLDGDGK
jgi:hypothetical protein